MLPPPCWIDAMAFGQAILRGGENPWTKPDELGLFHRELASLLNLEMIEVSLEKAISAYLEMSPDIEMGDDVGAVEDFLGDPAFTSFVTKGLDVVLGVVGARPVALSLPGAGLIARRFLANQSIDEDTLDDLSMALTGLLRAVSREGINFIRIEEIEPRALEFLAPLTNLAAHYQCATVLVLRNEVSSAAQAEGFDLVFRGPDILSADWWQGANEAMQSDSLFVEVPDDMTPEAVLRRYGDLKTSFA